MRPRVSTSAPRPLAPPRTRPLLTHPQGLHPSNTPFLLLLAFYALGTAATRAKHAAKARLVQSSTAAAARGRTPAQVLANSAAASALVLASLVPGAPARALAAGIVANYAATTADTLSSELGMLAWTAPRLITTGRRCAPGTNGGVTLEGLLAGVAGAAAIGAVAGEMRVALAAGAAGTVLDSLLGALAQESVVDARSGRVVEAPGGGRVLVGAGASRRSVGGRDLLTNNGVNFVMAAAAAAGAVAATWARA